MSHDEYLRRNLVHAGSIGVRSGIEAIIKRLQRTSRVPKWLLRDLDGLIVRAIRSSDELAKWRNAAPDAPGNLYGMTKGKPFVVLPDGTVKG